MKPTEYWQQKKLEHDIRNTTSHIYGDHKLCNPDFCKAKSNVSHQDQNQDDDSEVECEDIFQEQSEFWDAGTSLQAQEDSRGPNWSPNVWAQTTETTSGLYFDKLYKQREQCIDNNNKSKDKKEIKERRWKRKMSSLKESNSNKAKQHYGNESIQPESDVSENELTKFMLMKIILKKTPSLKKKEGKRKDLTTDDEEAQGPSNLNDHKKTIRRTRRKCSQLKFLGRRISHEWIEEDNTSKWYSGTVTGVLTETDGADGAEYEVLYDGDDEPHIIDHLLEDYRSCSLKFIDL
ncbi:unnamed protein product [Mytilus edulis]|uniref:Uncharacterized protein n=1 Tax=Mytilus edulis TaxID=6550 RepID=A0A8S3R985_MYTED|nr:unnamed protein product [Mytilus edulis]